MQVRAAAAALRHDGSISSRGESDAWLIRVEVLHHQAGQGQLIVRQLVDELHSLWHRSGPASLGQNSDPPGNSPMELVATLERLQQRLAELSIQAGPAAPSPEVESGQLQELRYISDSMLRVPFDELPMGARFRQLSRAVDQYFAATFLPGKAREWNAKEMELLQLQQQAMAHMVLTWGRMDLFSLALSQNLLLAESVYETPVDRPLIFAKHIVLGLGLALCSGVVVLFPVIWCLDNRNRIIRSAT